ncbi:hypothetical protein ACROHD_04510 [Nioella aestuarii]
MEQFIPPVQYLISLIVFGTISFEIKRWSNQMSRGGPRGSSQAFVAYVMLASTITTLFSLTMIGLTFWYGGWQVAVGLAVLGFVAGIVISGFLSPFLWGDSFAIRIICALAIWPVGFWVIMEFRQAFS